LGNSLPGFRFAPSGLQICSQLASAAVAELGNGFVGKPVELAALCIPFDLVVETGGIEFFEPYAKFSRARPRPAWKSLV
jgi:hypothetical protein